MHPDSADKVLREAFDRAGIKGASTHSFRRTALTQMSNAGIPLRIIQEISGHNNLQQLQHYLEVKPDQESEERSPLFPCFPTGGKRYFPTYRLNCPLCR
ncbi:tyrosine-type recombinase/integrase [Microcoleus vaginatus]|uniref:tyrosine-type recombinase/integrase n=1 Tax=Microcoleus vaginatus TaxID=119532 RepID=UPI001F61E325